MREAKGGLDLGTNFGQWGELRLGPVWRNVKAGTQTGAPGLPDLNTNASGLRVRLFGDRLDEPWFPRAGDRLTADRVPHLLEHGRGPAVLARRTSPSSMPRASARTPSRSAPRAASNFGSSLPAYDSFLLGGPFRLSGYAINQFSGQQDAFGSVRYLQQLTRLPSPLGSGAYAGGSIEGGRVNKLYDGRDTTGTALVFLRVRRREHVPRAGLARPGLRPRRQQERLHPHRRALKAGARESFSLPPGRASSGSVMVRVKMPTSS